MREKLEAMVYASLIADALTNNDAPEQSTTSELVLEPGLYGMETIALLRALVDHGGYDRDTFLREWQISLQQELASRRSLEELDAGRQALLESASGSGARSTTSDIAAACRIAPLAYLYHDHKQELLESVTAQAELAYSDPKLTETALFLAYTAWEVLNGHTPSAAMQRVLDNQELPQISDLIRMGLEEPHGPETGPIGTLSTGSGIAEALPALVHIIVNHEGNLRRALQTNREADGAVSGRGMAIGLILGAFHGMDGIPEEWQTGLSVSDEVATLLDELDSRLGHSA